MLRCILIAVVCLALAGCNSPRNSSVTAFNPDLLNTDDTTEVPLIHSPNSQWQVRATVNGVTGLFAVDTGAGFTSVTPQFAQKIREYQNLNPSYDHNHYAKIISFNLGDMDYLGFYAPILNLDHINREIHTNLSGILGNNVLAKKVFSIDWKRNVLILDTRPTPRPTNAIPITIRSNLIYVTATVNGQPTEFALDTGAYRTVLSESEISRLKIPAENITHVEALLIDIHQARRTNQLLIKLDSFELGPIDRKNLSVLTWHQDALGMDLLERWVLTINARENWLTFTEAVSK